MQLSIKPEPKYLGTKPFHLFFRCSIQPDEILQCISQNKCQTLANILSHSLVVNIDLLYHENFYIALHKRWFTCCDILLKYGMDINFIDKDGDTYIMKVCKSDADESDIISYLVNNKASLDNVSNGKLSPCINAIKAKNLENVKSLHSLGAQVTLYDHEKKTPVLHCANEGAFDILNYLIDAGVTPVCFDHFGSSPFLIALSKFPNNKYKEKYFDKLLRVPETLNACNAAGNTPFLQSILNKDIIACKMLLKMGCHRKIKKSVIDHMLGFVLDYTQPSKTAHMCNLYFFGTGNYLPISDNIHNEHPIIFEMKKDCFEKSLHRLCRKVIRSQLSKNNANFYHIVSQLPLPTSVQDFLLYW